MLSIRLCIANVSRTGQARSSTWSECSPWLFYLSPLSSSPRCPDFARTVNMGFFSSDTKGASEAQPAASSSSLYPAPPPPPAFAPPGHSDDKHAAAPPGYVAPPPNSSYAQKRPDAPQYAALHLAQSDRIRLIGFSLDCNHVVQVCEASDSFYSVLRAQSGH